MKQHEATELSSGHGFLEAPRWHEGKLWLSDFFRKQVLTITENGAVEQVMEVENSPSGLGFLSDGSLLVVSQHDRSVLRRATDGSVSTYADLSAIAGGIANDMLVTPSDHAYVGNFGFALGQEDPRTTHLAHIRPDGTVDTVAGDVLFPNGMGLLPDGTTLVLAETLAHKLSAFDVAADGSLTNYRLWAQLPDTINPDGITVDSDGGV